MSISSIRLVSTIALLAGLSVCGAEAADPPGSTAGRKKAEQSLITLPNVSDVQRPGIFLTAQASSDDKTGTAATAIENRDGTFSVSLALSGPLDSSTKETTPLTLKGLGNSSNASVGLHWFYWPGRIDVDAQKALCQTALSKEFCKLEELADPKQRAEFIRVSHAADAPVIVNAGASVGRNGFKYLDSATLAATSIARTDWSANVSVGRYAPSTGYVAVGYEYQRRFQGGTASQICLPVGGTSALQCKNAVVGAPRENTLNVGSVEWRRFFPGGHAALDVTVARDFSEDVTAVDVPFYFLSSPQGGLTGGARASWRSDTRDIAVAVFIGTALKLTQ